MAFPKEKTDWSLTEQPVEDGEHPSGLEARSRKLSSSHHVASYPENASYRGTIVKSGFFKSISINEPEAPQERFAPQGSFNSRKISTGKRLQDSALPNSALPKLGSLFDYSKGYLSKGLSGVTSTPLSNFKKLLSFKPKQARYKADSTSQNDREFSAITHHSNVTIYERAGRLSDNRTLTGDEISFDRSAYDESAHNQAAEEGQTTSSRIGGTDTSSNLLEGHSREANLSNYRKSLFAGNSSGEVRSSSSSMGSRRFSGAESLAKGTRLNSEGREEIKLEDPVVRCPACQTRFYVDAEVLAKYQQSGRKPQFHCSKCDHVFSSSLTAFNSSIPTEQHESSTNEAGGWEQTKATSPNNSSLSSHQPNEDFGQDAYGSTQKNAVKGDGFDPVSQEGVGLGEGSSQKTINKVHNEETQDISSLTQPSQDTTVEASGNYTPDEQRSSEHSRSNNSELGLASQIPSTLSSSRGAIYPDDDQPLVTHFDDEVKPQNIPWEVKRSTSDGSLQRSVSLSSALSAKMFATQMEPGERENVQSSPELTHSGLGTPDDELQSAIKRRAKKIKNRQKRAPGDSLSIWTLAKKMLSPGGSKGQSAKDRLSQDRGASSLSTVHPYLSSNQRRLNSAPIESATTEADQLPLSLRPSKPSTWYYLRGIAARGPRERWVGAALIGAPMLVVLIILAVFSYSIRISLPAYEMMASSLGLKSSEIAPVGLTVHDATFKSMVLESGETVYTISGRVVNSTDRNFKEISVEGLTFNAQGQLTSKAFATLGNALNIAKLKALPLEDILSLQQKKRDQSAILKPGQSEKFIIALSDKKLSDQVQGSKKSPAAASSLPIEERSVSASTSGGELKQGAPLAETEFFSARVYLVN